MKIDPESWPITGYLKRGWSVSRLYLSTRDPSSANNQRTMDDDEFSADALVKQRAAKAAQLKQAQEAALKEDPELAAIYAETKQTQKDTLASTQNSVRIIKDTTVIADNTATKVQQQGEQLDRIEEKAQLADANAADSYQSARELHKYKGLLPLSIKNMVSGGKKREEDDKLAKTTKKLDKEEKKLDKAAAANVPSLDTSSTAAPATDYGGDKTEEQIDRNLDEISAGLDHLQMQAASMHTELNKQNLTIKRIEATTEHTDYTLNSANRKIQEFM